MFLLFLILLWSILSRFWFLGTIPPSSEPSISGRYVSAILSIVSLLLTYFLSFIYTKKRTTSLLASFIFAILPWTIEQGRIFSNMQIFIPLFQLSKPLNIIVNIFTLLSPEMLFFHNKTFWWGGVREFGMLFASFIPFVFVGSMVALHQRMWMPIAFILMCAFIAASNPLFPEGRFFYLTTPFLSFITAIGVHVLYIQKNKITRSLFWLLLTVFIYEMMQFWHYYLVHYPQIIRGNIGNIVGAF